MSDNLGRKAKASKDTGFHEQKLPQHEELLHVFKHSVHSQDHSSACLFLPNLVSS